MNKDLDFGLSSEALQRAMDAMYENGYVPDSHVYWIPSNTYDAFEKAGFDMRLFRKITQFVKTS